MELIVPDKRCHFRLFSAIKVTRAVAQPSSIQVALKFAGCSMQLKAIFAALNLKKL